MSKNDRNRVTLKERRQLKIINFESLIIRVSLYNGHANLYMESYLKTVPPLCLTIRNILLIFVFPRINTIAMRSLSTAMEFWSGGTMKENTIN